jgi:hypothetical protein
VFQCWEEPSRKALRRWFASGRSRSAQVVAASSTTAD